MPSWRWWTWSVLLMLWTIALVVPVPPPGELPLGDWLWTRKFLVAKALHVAAYAVLAAAVPWLSDVPRRRWLMSGRKPMIRRRQPK